MRILLLLLGFPALLSAQEVIEVEEQTPLSAFQLFLLSGQDMRNGIENYRVTYTTTDAFGQPDTASGLVCVPIDPDFVYPLGVYNHGTVADPEAVPSRELVPERLLPQLMGGRGMLTVAPDYLGLGDSDGFHPYVHAATEASAGRDMLIAVRAWLESNGRVVGSEVFVTGYSQGGHAAAALHRELVDNPVPALNVGAAAYLSGPYSISEVMLGTLFSDSLNTLPGYIAYTYVSYNAVYGFTDDLAEVFAEPYLTEVRLLDAGTTTLGEFNAALEELLPANDHQLIDLFQDSVQQILRTRDTTTTVIQALIDNDTYDWAPQEPTLIYYCTADEQVPFQNALLADSVMRANGSTEITLTNGGELTHGGCVVPAFTAALEFFNPLIDIVPVSDRYLADGFAPIVFPNPVAAGGSLRFLEETTPQSYEIHDSSGRRITGGLLTTAGTVRLPRDLPPGVYTLRLGYTEGTVSVHRFVCH